MRKKLNSGIKYIFTLGFNMVGLAVLPYFNFSFIKRIYTVFIVIF